MALYYYKGRSFGGKEISGLLNTENMYLVAKRIKDRGFVPVKIREVNTNSFLYLLMAFFKRPSPNELAVFCRQFGAMIEAGADIIESLNFIINKTQNRKMRNIFIDINWHIKCGYSLADALKNYPYVFSEVFVAMIEAGEASGNLSAIFEMLSGYYSDIARRSEKVKNVLAYPCILGITSFVVIIFLTIKVLPVYANIYSSFGAKLPRSTQMLMWISSHIAQIFIIALLLLFALLPILSRCIKSERLSYQLDKLMLSIPFVSELVKKDLSARIMRVLYILVSSGIPILNAIEIAADTVKNRVMIRELQKMMIGLSQGKNLSEVLSEKVFPPIMTKMVATGEEAGVLEKTLGMVALMHENDVDILQERLMALMEPVIIIVFTIITAFIVVSMVMPMFEIYKLF